MARLLQPRSLRVLLATAFVAVAVPLVAAIVWAAVTADGLSAANERLVAQAMETTALGENLSVLAFEMERNARQYAITRSEDLLRLYRSRRAPFIDTLAGLRSNGWPEDVQGAFEELREAVGLVDRLLDRPQARPGIAEMNEALAKAVAAAFEPVPALVDGLREASRSKIATDLEALVAEQRRTSRRLLLVSAALFGVAMLTALGFTRLIARPIREVADAIHGIGAGTAADPVSIRGPKDLEDLGKEVEWLRVQLQRADDEKNRFLRHMSHELKTPLTNIREGSELLADGSVDASAEQRSSVVGIVRENAARLHGLIDRLLDFAAWQAHEGQLSPRRVELRGIVQHVLRNYRLATEARGLEVHLDVPADLVLLADPRRLETVLDNLMSNAIRYSPPGGAIYIRAQRNHDRVLLEVEDEGPGVTVEDGDKVFEPFYQGKTQAAGAVSGTGIGLSLVKTFVEAHGGTVAIVDKDSPGACFRVEIPLDGSG